jgi:PleD family two-component response regulator
MKRIVRTARGGRQRSESKLLPWSGSTVTQPEEASTARLLSLAGIDWTLPDRRAQRGTPALTRFYSGRILVVSNDTFERLEIEALLLAHGYTVVSASTFEEASGLLQTIPLDLVVTAVRLGAFNGIHLAMRSQWQDPQRTVIVTNESQDASLSEQAESEGVRYVARPLENPEFLANVEEALGRRNSAELMA